MIPGKSKRLVSYSMNEDLVMENAEV